MRTKILSGMAIVSAGLLFYQILFGLDETQRWVKFSSPEADLKFLCPDNQ